jgi:hypothetical protein
VGLSGVGWLWGCDLEADVAFGADGAACDAADVDGEVEHAGCAVDGDGVLDAFAHAEEVIIVVVLVGIKGSEPVGLGVRGFLDFVVGDVERVAAGFFLSVMEDGGSADGAMKGVVPVVFKLDQGGGHGCLQSLADVSGRHSP